MGAGSAGELPAHSGDDGARQGSTNPGACLPVCRRHRGAAAVLARAPHRQDRRPPAADCRACRMPAGVLIPRDACRLNIASTGWPFLLLELDYRTIFGARDSHHHASCVTPWLRSIVLRGHCLLQGRWVVTGGLGSLGLLTAQWLAGRGRRHITLLSRSGR